MGFSSERYWGAASYVWNSKTAAYPPPQGRTEGEGGHNIPGSADMSQQYRKYSTVATPALGLLGLSLSFRLRAACFVDLCHHPLH